jgi:hypothetical protein
LEDAELETDEDTDAPDSERIEESLREEDLESSRSEPRRTPPNIFCEHRFSLCDDRGEDMAESAGGGFEAILVATFAFLDEPAEIPRDSSGTLLSETCDCSRGFADESKRGCGGGGNGTPRLIAVEETGSGECAEAADLWEGAATAIDGESWILAWLC